MRLGIGSYACTWAIGVPGSPPDQPMTVHGFLDWAHELGLHLAQIADNLPLDTLPADELRDLVRHARELDIELEIGTRGIAPEQLQRYLRIAAQCGSRILRVVVDTEDHRPSPEEVVRLLRCQTPALEAEGVVLAIENHDRFTSLVLAQMVDQLNSSAVGICLDTVNSFGALEGPAVVLERLGRHVVNLHLKDFRVRRISHMMGFVVEGTPAGEGQLNVPWLLSTLAKGRRDPNAILELWPAPEQTLNATIEKEQAWARQSIAYLRRLMA